MCRIYQEQTAHLFDCSSCEDKCPQLLPENRTAWMIWLLANTQWRVNTFSLVGLDYPAVFQIAEIYGIDITPAIYEKLKILELHELARQKKEGEHGRGSSNN